MPFVLLIAFSVEKHGEMSIEAARLYYEYGNAMLTQEEDNPSNGLLSNVEGEEVKDIEVEDEEEEEAAEGAEEGEGEEEEGAAAADDLQAAWELLDVARCILEKEADADRNLLLSDVYIRLADLMKLNDTIAEAIEEYSKALQIRLTACAANDRSLSDAHYSLAVAHVYNSAEKEADALGEKRKALEHYRKARGVLLLGTGVGAGGAGKEEEDKDIVDVLTETIDALAAEIADMDKASSSSSTSSGVGVTTIGFGAPSSSNASSAVPLLLGKRGAGEEVPQQVLQVKKKAKAEALPAATASAGDSKQE